MIPSMSNDLSIAAVTAPEDVRQACDVLLEAAHWLIANGRELWKPQWLVPERAAGGRQGSALSCAWDGRPVGVFQLLIDDPIFWPEQPAGIAMYVHRLAVSRSVGGQGISRRLLDHAAQETATAGRPLLRLDCLRRPALIAFYESAGFTKHSDGNYGGYEVRRFECHCLSGDTTTRFKRRFGDAVTMRSSTIFKPRLPSKSAG